MSTACSKNFPKTMPLSHITDPVTPGVIYKNIIQGQKVTRRVIILANFVYQSQRNKRIGAIIKILSMSLLCMAVDMKNVVETIEKAIITIF